MISHRIVSVPVRVSHLANSGLVARSVAQSLSRLASRRSGACPPARVVRTDPSARSDGARTALGTLPRFSRLGTRSFTMDHGAHRSPRNPENRRRCFTPSLADSSPAVVLIYVRSFAPSLPSLASRLHGSRRPILPQSTGTDLHLGPCPRICSRSHRRSHRSPLAVTTNCRWPVPECPVAPDRHRFAPRARVHGFAVARIAARIDRRSP